MAVGVLDEGSASARRRLVGRLLDDAVVIDSLEGVVTALDADGDVIPGAARLEVGLALGIGKLEFDAIVGGDVAMFGLPVLALEGLGVLEAQLLDVEASGFLGVSDVETGVNQVHVAPVIRQSIKNGIVGIADIGGSRLDPSPIRLIIRSLVRSRREWPPGGRFVRA